MDFGHHAENVCQADVAVWGCTREQRGLVRKESEPETTKNSGEKDSREYRLTAVMSSGR